MDCVQIDRDLRARRRDGRRPDWLFWGVFLALAALSLAIFLREMGYGDSDLALHAFDASNFDFSDLHSITCRGAYPLWHLCVAVLYQLGLPLSWSAALVCLAFKLLTALIVRAFVRAALRGATSRTTVTALTLALMVVTGLLIPGVSQRVYRGWYEATGDVYGIGSPTVWHNPTQIAAICTGLLCAIYLMHCWYELERRLPKDGDKAALPWSKVIVLAVLLMANLACKPTFMQSLIPAAAVFFLVEWIRHPRNSRFFVQIILAFLPACGYFLLQYLYYTGVVVPFTSGVAVQATAENVWAAVRSTLLMTAFPLYAVICCWRKGFMRDKLLVLALLMVAFSAIEAAAFHETGERMGHGNFTWSMMSSAYLLWVAILPKFAASLSEYRAALAGQPVPPCAVGLGDAPVRPSVPRTVAYVVGLALLAWHLYSSAYYLIYLFTTSNTF